ncbi:MAG: alpha/beta hydrolase [Candidatus Heimdallarchaeota archaeon]|nr:MAG: alpha/beta hydrolase [Candidatus Heimdallarchaeota archaeon]
MDTEIDYDYNPAANSDFPTIVFIHGAGGDKRQWKRQKDYFQSLGFGLVIPSLPGHGESQLPDSVSIKDYSNVIIRLLDYIKLSKLTLIGHSMGGAIALQVLLEYSPSMIDNLVLIGTGAKLNVAPIFFELIENDFKEALRLMGEYSYGKKATLQIKRENEKILRHNGAQILTHDFEACRQFDIRTELGKIQISTLIICGQDDKMTPVKFSTYLHTHLANSQLELIPDTGHFVFQEAPEKVNNCIHDFISV